MNLDKFFSGYETHAYEYMGAHPKDDGVEFYLWAPHAYKVEVFMSRDSFNKFYPMDKVDERGIWHLFIEDLECIYSYRYRIYTNKNNYVDKSDPYAFYSELRPANASVMYDLNYYKFTDDKYMDKRTFSYDNPLNIYELHLNGFKKDKEFATYVAEKIDTYEKEQYISLLKLVNAKNEDDLSRNYEECYIDYILSERKYCFGLGWVYKEGKRFFLDDSPSTGKKGILTFDNALEFYDDVLPEQLGEMIMEAFERSNKMAAAMSRGTLPDKEIDLLEGTIVTVTPPKDKHFVDNEDAGVGEIYQDYAYIAKEDAESSADFMLTVAPELYEELSCDNIRLAWIEAFGEAEEISVTETEYGIFSYRAELKNKKMYRIAYFRELNDGTAVECCMEIPNPSKKKRLTEKLPSMFEQFAGKCRI